MKYYEPKPLFLERMRMLLKDEDDLKKYLEYLKKPYKKSIRVNTLKISPENLVKRLENMGWKIIQPIKEHPEILIVDSLLMPGELGKTKEHILGYYYVQEMTSMMPILALFPKNNDKVLDLCASPGSKTSQMASMMENKGTIIANDLSINRIAILSSNLEKCGVSNVIVTRHPGVELCQKLKKLNFKFDKILVDAPCSGEGNIRSSPRTLLEWSEGLLHSLSRKQKALLVAAYELLKEDGEIVYSTCTHSPEENEEVIQSLLDKFDNVKIENVDLPIKSRAGITEWKGKKLFNELKKAKRIYPHDEDYEGFFLCKMRKMKK